MARIYAVRLSARTRGARWRTVTLDTRITASSMHIAAARAVKATEHAEAYRPVKLGAMTLHIEEVGTAPRAERPQ